MARCSFELAFETENAAFADGNLAQETARILREVADRVEKFGFATHEQTIRDINGNTVGAYYFANLTVPDEDE